MDSGHFSDGLWNKYFGIEIELFGPGKSLPDLRDEVAEAATTAKELNHGSQQHMMEVQWQLVLNLIGSTNTTILTGDVMKEEDKAIVFRDAPAILLCIRRACISARFMFDDYAGVMALRKVTSETEVIEACPGMFTLPVMCHQNSLAAISMYRETKKPKYKRLACRLGAKVKRWANNGVSSPRVS